MFQKTLHIHKIIRSLISTDYWSMSNICSMVAESFLKFNVKVTLNILNPLKLYLGIFWEPIIIFLRTSTKKNKTGLIEIMIWRLFLLLHSRQLIWELFFYQYYFVWLPSIVVLLDLNGFDIVLLFYALSNGTPFYFI